MLDPWQTLRAGGLPLGTHDPDAIKPSARELAYAVECAIATEPTGRERDALAAFILAWRRHWPSSFARELGPTAASVERWADRAVDDPNRYLKLARIATEHLASIL